TFDDDFSPCRNDNVDGLAAYDFDRRSCQSSGNGELAFSVRHARGCGISDSRRSTHDQGRLEWDPFRPALAPVDSSVIPRRERNAHSGRTFNLAAVVSNVQNSTFG